MVIESGLLIKALRYMSKNIGAHIWQIQEAVEMQLFDEIGVLELGLLEVLEYLLDVHESAVDLMEAQQLVLVVDGKYFGEKGEDGAVADRTDEQLVHARVDVSGDGCVDGVVGAAARDVEQLAQAQHQMVDALDRGEMRHELVDQLDAQAYLVALLVAHELRVVDVVVVCRRRQ